MSGRSAYLTFLAPADRCNQRCPQCVLELGGEANLSRSFALAPDDYVGFMGALEREGYVVRSVSFHGYEVTLPRSWPYLTAVFDAAIERGVPRLGFVTNGMLLSRYTEPLSRYRQLVSSLSVMVSLDGSDSDTNDRHRGLPGAFKATMSSLRDLLERVPLLAGHVMIASVLYRGQNLDSLAHMPELLLDLGVWTWGVEGELASSDAHDPSISAPAGLSGLTTREADEEELVRQLRHLQRLAEASGIRCHTGRCTLGRMQGICSSELDMGEDFVELRDAVSFRFLPSGTVFQTSSAPAQQSLTHRFEWGSGPHVVSR